MMGPQRRAKSSYPSAMTSLLTGGYMATYLQILEPVKPVTTSAPSLAATLAVSLSSAAARVRTPSASDSPAPHTRSPSRPRWRKSMGSSHTAWPVEWLEMA